MLKRLGMSIRRVLPRTKMMVAQIATTPELSEDKPNIVDINMEDMMKDDVDWPFGQQNADEQPLTKIVGLDGLPLAPVDIDAWTDPEELKQGTVDIEPFEKDKEIEYPPIPNDRSGIYEFKGIKVRLPQRMLKPETYRYRLEKSEQETLPDDIRVCVFEK